MPHHECFGEHPFQFAQQGGERGFLRRCAGVGGAAVGIQPAFVADAYGVAVVVQAVCADAFQRTSAVNGAVARQVEVVADVAEAAVADVVAAAIVKAQAHALRRGRAVNDEERDGSHRPMQELRPNTPAKAVAMATMVLRTMPHTDLEDVDMSLKILECFDFRMLSFQILDFRFHSFDFRAL